MKKHFFVFVAILVSLACTNCKEETKKVLSEDNKVSSDSLESEVYAQEKTAAEMKYYVIAPSGLSLRKENNLESEKLLGMLLGNEVIILEETTTSDLEVEHIKGGMHKVSFNGQSGYAFSGFLSPIRLRQKDETMENYLADLKKEFPKIRFESKPNDPDFHEGTTDTFTLPASSWHEAYYIVSAIYGIPKNLNYPNPSGPEQSVIEDPKKPQEAWDSFLTATRKNNALEKIEYSYRAEGFGYGITITQPTKNGFTVEYLGFVD